MVRPQDPPKIASDINFSKLGKSLKIFPFKVIQKYSGNFRNTTLLGHKCYNSTFLLLNTHVPSKKKRKKCVETSFSTTKKEEHLGILGAPLFMDPSLSD